MIGKLRDILKRYRKNNGNVIFLLQETQESLGYVPRQAIDFFSEELGIAASRFYGVATFYSQFRLKPAGRNKIVTCCGTACHVNGAERIIGSIRRELNLQGGEDTSADGEFTLEEVACLGTCSFAPVVLINGAVHGKTESKRLIREIRSLKKADG